MVMPEQASRRASRSSGSIEKYVLFYYYFHAHFARVEKFIGVNASGEFSWIVGCAWAVLSASARVSCDFKPLHQADNLRLHTIHSWTRIVYSPHNCTHTHTIKLGAYTKSNAKPVFLRLLRVRWAMIVIFSHSKYADFPSIYAALLLLLLLISNEFAIVNFGINWCVCKCDVYYFIQQRLHRFTASPQLIRNGIDWHLFSIHIHRLVSESNRNVRTMCRVCRE